MRALLAACLWMVGVGAAFAGPDAVIAGSWRGIVTEGDLKYEMRMVLHGDGDGVVDYEVYQCRGLMKLIAASPNLRFRETIVDNAPIAGGKCGDGLVDLVPSGKQLMWTWRPAPNAPAQASATLSRDK